MHPGWIRISLNINLTNALVYLRFLEINIMTQMLSVELNFYWTRKHNDGSEQGSSKHYAGPNGRVFSLKHIHAAMLHFSIV